MKIFFFENMIHRVHFLFYLERRLFLDNKSIRRILFHALCVDFVRVSWGDVVHLDRVLGEEDGVQYRKQAQVLLF